MTVPGQDIDGVARRGLMFVLSSPSAAGKPTLFQYYVGSHRVAVQTDPSGSVFTRHYDPLGRVVDETATPGGIPDTVENVFG